MRIKRSLLLVAFLLVLYIVPVISPVSYGRVTIPIQKNMILASGETLTLRPDGDVWTNLTKSGGSFNYEMVDEETHDSDSTTVYKSSPPMGWDRYTLEDHTIESGPINNLTVYYYAKKNAAGGATRAHGIADSSSSTTSGSNSLTVTYDLYSETYSTKPSGGAWTWDEVDNAEVLLALGGVPVPATIGYCTQIYVVVNYDDDSQWHVVNDVDLIFNVPFHMWGYNAALIILGLVMIPVSTIYLAYGAKHDRSSDRLFYGLILFVVGCGLFIGGIIP